MNNIEKIIKTESAQGCTKNSHQFETQELITQLHIIKHHNARLK